MARTASTGAWSTVSIVSAKSLPIIPMLCSAMASTPGNGPGPTMIWAQLLFGVTGSGKTLVANLVGPDRRGLAYGWFNAAVGIGTLPASLLFGWLYQTLGALAAFGAGGLLALLAGLLAGLTNLVNPVFELFPFAAALLLWLRS